MPTAPAPDQTAIDRARTDLDAWVRELMQWHFSPETGCPFWLQWAESAGWDPRKRDRPATPTSTSSALFQDEWLRGGPVRRWVPRAYQDRPIYTFETGGSTGVPKSRINIDDFRIDYEHVQHARCRTISFRRAPTGCRSARADRAGCASPSSTSRSIAAASASWSISIRAGSSS